MHKCSPFTLCIVINGVITMFACVYYGCMKFFLFMATFVLAYYLLFYVLCRATVFTHMNVIHHCLMFKMNNFFALLKRTPLRRRWFLQIQNTLTWSMT